jgi:histone-binding protein RBBP4
MPQNVDLIATKTTMGEVYVFDRTKHSLVPKDGEECRPEITLRGHKKEGCVWSELCVPTMGLA